MKELEARAAAAECSNEKLIWWMTMHLNRTTVISEFLLPILKAEAAKRNL